MAGRLDVNEWDRAVQISDAKSILTVVRQNSKIREIGIALDTR